MYPSLIFHSFNNNSHSDKFYDIGFYEYKNLIDYLSKNFESEKITITFDDGFKSIIKPVEYALEKGFKAIAYIITDYVNKEGFLSIKDIKYLHNIGCIIGSHSKSHKDLSKVSSQVLKFELEESKIFLENIIKEKIHDFSFPYGKNNKYLFNIVKSFYKFNAISRPNFFKEKNIVGRISVNSLNCKNHREILILLKKRFPLKYLLRLILSFTLKNLMPNNYYLFFKNIIVKNKSKDVFRKNLH